MQWVLRVAFIFLWLCCLFHPFNVEAKSYDDIFKQVFGRIPEKQYFTQQMALVVDGQFVGDGLQVLVPSVGSDYKFFSYSLLKYLYESQKPGTVRNLTLKIDEEGMLSLADIQSVGYKVVVDRRGFKVLVEVPPEYRKKIVYYIMGEPEPLPGNSSSQLKSPAKLSGYLNYSFTMSYLNLPDTKEVQPTADLEEAVELGDEMVGDAPESGMELPIGSFYGISKTGPYSLHYSGAFDFGSNQVFNLADLNIQRDYGEKNKRWMVGQVAPYIKGSQSSLSLFGLGYTSGPVLNQIGNFSPQFSHTIDLDVDSLIEVYINYRKVKESELPGGVYELRGFPLRNGFNTVKIVKTSAYDVPPPTKEVYVSDGEYNDIQQGVLYRTLPAQGESHMDQSMRLHKARRDSSEWLISDKIPRRGLELKEDQPPSKSGKNRVLFSFSG